MDNVVGALLNLLNPANEFSDEQVMSFIRDNQTDLVKIMTDEHQGARRATEMALASFDDLFHEMRHRTTALVVAAEFDRTQATNRVRVVYDGGLVSGMGLVEYAKRELEAEQDAANDASEEPHDPHASPQG